MANLDLSASQAVAETLARLHRRGVTLVAIEHRLELLAPYAERLIWLEEGRVVDEGPSDAVLARVQPPWLATPPPASDGAPLVALDGIAAGYDGQPVLEDCSLTAISRRWWARMAPARRPWPGCWPG
jgi:energy-coupling factor transporter ATP-binding protein EcfA2